MTALLLTPLLLLGLLEGALRLLGYGYPTGFFLRAQAEGRFIWVENEKFGWRFFPKRLARRPLPMRMSHAQDSSRFRIFVLGESAAMGDPEPAFGFSRILEVLLQDRFPGAPVEVINTAFTAINSHAILPIARDIAKHDGDVWILYLGHNEVAGPFGPGTVFGANQLSLPLIRASLAVKTTRLGQGLETVLASFRARSGQAVPENWEGLQMFLDRQIRLEDPALLPVFDHFRKNLDDIIRMGRQSGAAIVAGMAASNLKDCAPFASTHASGLAQADLALWEKAFQEGSALEAAGVYDQAVTRYLAAEKIDPTHAELQYRLGRCFRELQDKTEASRRFVLARDLDTLRFRADSRLREITKDAAAAANRPEAPVLLLDAHELLAQASSDGIPGGEYFFDHVHLTFDGNYLLARALAEKVVEARPSIASAGDNGQWASSDVCARKLALTGWDQYHIWESMSRRLREAPFTNQSNHALRQERYNARLTELRGNLEPSALPHAVQVYQEALLARPKDYFLRSNFSKLLQAQGQTELAIAELRRVIELLPTHSTAFYNLGLLLNNLGRPEEAARYFREILRRTPDLAEAHNGLGSAVAGQGDFARAIMHFEQALELRPSYAEAALNLGQAFHRLGRLQDALAALQNALRLNPDSHAVQLSMGNLLMDMGEVLQGIAHVSEAARLQPVTVVARLTEELQKNPGHAIAHVKLANALAASNRRIEALQQLYEAVRHQTNFWEARYLLGVELASLGKLPEAQEQFEAVIRLKPGYARAHLNLGVALANQSNLAGAALHFREALKLDPTNQLARDYLGRIQGLKP